MGTIEHPLPAGPFLSNPTEHMPLLKRYSMYLDEPDMFEDMEMGDYVLYRDVWELITSGELRVYKNLGVRLTSKGTLCNACDKWINVAYDKFCPECGERL